MSSNAIISFFLAMFVQSIPGVDGIGMIIMIVYIILVLFVVGLIVGKTPEFMGMKITPKDIKIVVFIFILHQILILIPTVISLYSSNVQSLFEGKVMPLGFTGMLYEYTSAASNSGSDYFGSNANTPYWNWSTTIVMFFGKYLSLALVLSLAGSFAIKDRKNHRTYKNRRSCIHIYSGSHDFLIDDIIFFSFSNFRSLFDLINEK